MMATVVAPEFLTNLPGGQITMFLVLLISLSVLFQIVLMLILRIAAFLVGKTQTTLDDRILNTLGKYLPWIASVTALMMALQMAYPGFAIGSFRDFDLYVIAMLGIAGLVLSAVADTLLVWYGIEMHAGGRKTIKEEEVFPFVRNIVKIVIILIFLVFIMQRLGFDTTAILTGLGVGGLAVALALQDTLGNFFGGVHILVDKPFREEDYIKLENGLEGTVKQIGWRTTRMLTPTNTTVIVPNSKLAGAVLENFSSRTKGIGVSYTIGVDCKEDLEKIEKVLLEAVKNAAKTCETIDPATIAVRFDNFGDYSLNFKYGYELKNYSGRINALKAVNREIFYSFKKEGIEIPFPVRTVYNISDTVQSVVSVPAGKK